MPEPATPSLVFERTVPHSPEGVWRGLTESPLIAKWLYENDFQPDVGHKFSFRGKPRPHWNGVIDGEVLIVEPNERLVYTWGASYEDKKGGLKTIVAWTLTPNDDGTQVRVEQSGFRSAEEAEGPRYGWERLLAGLEKAVAGAG